MNGIRKALKAVACFASCAIVLMGLSLVGCADQESRSSNAIAIVLEKTQTCQLAEGAEPCVQQLLSDVIRDGGMYSITLASSKPETIAFTAVRANSNVSDPALRGRWERDNVFEIARNVDDYRPSYPEVDPLESMRLAAGTLCSDAAQTCNSKTLVYVGTAVPTAGLLDCTGGGKYSDVLEWDYDELVSAIVDSTSSDVARAEALPDLTGIHVVFVGFGRLTAGSQCEIPPERIAQLKSLWAKVLDACGAEFDPEVDFVEYGVIAASSDVDLSEYPMVYGRNRLEPPLSASTAMCLNLSLVHPSTSNIPRTTSTQC